MAQIKLNATYGMTGTLPAVSGANLTTLNGSNISSGTVADARISALTSSKLTGNLPALNASALTNLDARDLENALPAISGASLTGLTPNQPSCSVYNTDGDEYFSDETWHLLQMTAEIYDNGGCFNNTGSSVTLNSLTAPAYSFTPNVAGYYYCTFYCTGDAQSDNQLVDMSMSIYKNGATHLAMEVNKSTASDMMDANMIGGIIQLNGTGDYIQPYVYVNDTSAHGVSVKYNGSYPKNCFTAFKIGT